MQVFGQLFSWRHPKQLLAVHGLAALAGASSHVSVTHFFDIVLLAEVWSVSKSDWPHWQLVDLSGTTAYTYTSFGALLSEDGPWASDTVSYSYDNGRRRSGLNLQAPNASDWVQSNNASGRGLAFQSGDCGDLCKKALHDGKLTVLKP